MNEYQQSPVSTDTSPSDHSPLTNKWTFKTLYKDSTVNQIIQSFFVICIVFASIRPLTDSLLFQMKLARILIFLISLSHFVLMGYKGKYHSILSGKSIDSDTDNTLIKRLIVSCILTFVTFIIFVTLVLPEKYQIIVYRYLNKLLDLLIFIYLIYVEYQERENKKINNNASHKDKKKRNDEEFAYDNNVKNNVSVDKTDDKTDDTSGVNPYY